MGYTGSTICTPPWTCFYFNDYQSQVGTCPFLRRALINARLTSVFEESFKMNVSCLIIGLDDLVALSHLAETILIRIKSDLR